MSCYDCWYYTGEKILACGVDPITAASSPEEGCRDWQPIPNPWGFWDKLYMIESVFGEGEDSVPVDGWKFILCDYVPLSTPAVSYAPYRRGVDDDGILYVKVIRDEFELGYARAVDLPEPDDFEYESEFVDNEFDDD